jgi:hypothetical protein
MVFLRLKCAQLKHKKMQRRVKMDLCTLANEFFLYSIIIVYTALGASSLSLSVKGKDDRRFSTARG